MKTITQEKSERILGSPADIGSHALATRYWINPRFPQTTSQPWRKVDIEFHNSQYIPKIGERFNADEFGDQLLAAHVNGAVIFAKDMFGYSYYPTKWGPKHPGLSFDLFGAQVEALRKRKIAVYAYYMTTWNLELAERHPEWLSLKRDRTSYLPKFDETLGCSQETGICCTAELCLANKEFVDLELDHIRELVSRYEIDALWLDGLRGSQTHSLECYCSECLRQLRSKGLDPLNELVQYNNKVALSLSFLKKIYQVVKEVRPSCFVGPQNEGTFGLQERAPFIEFTDLEGLFTDMTWYGYYYAPTVIRFARGFGVPIYGLTTRFKSFWGDFGGLKLSSQLLTELATIVANGARCDIGDQMNPNARLDPAVYRIIGDAYHHIEKLEPYLEQAVPVTEAALLTSGRSLDSPCTSANFGWVKLLTESRIQFDLVEATSPWEQFALVILPDELAVDEQTASRLSAFISRGGAVVVTHKAGLLAGTNRSWLEPYGLRYSEMSPFKPAYLVPEDGLTDEIPPYEYALYDGASQWRTEPPAAVLAHLGEPLFQRTPDHYTSHAQSPFDHVTPYAALALSGRVALFAFPLGQSYYDQGYWIYRLAFQKVIRQILPVPIIQSDSPLSTELTLTHQVARADVQRPERYLVHIVNYSPSRQTPRHPNFCEDPIPLTNLTVLLNMPLRVESARAVVAGVDLPVHITSGGAIEVLVPKVPIHEVLCFEVN